MELVATFLGVALAYTLMLVFSVAVLVYGLFLCVSVLVWDRDSLGDIGTSGVIVVVGLRLAWLMWDIGAMLGSRLPPIF
ncbi:MAG: hypothetical protein AAB463_00920 [Patescibacteria group bacterium]